MFQLLNTPDVFNLFYYINEIIILLTIVRKNQESFTGVVIDCKSLQQLFTKLGCLHRQLENKKSSYPDDVDVAKIYLSKNAQQIRDYVLKIKEYAIILMNAEAVVKGYLEFLKNNNSFAEKAEKFFFYRWHLSSNEDRLSLDLLIGQIRKIISEDFDDKRIEKLKNLMNSVRNIIYISSRKTPGFFEQPLLLSDIKTNKVQRNRDEKRAEKLIFDLPLDLYDVIILMENLLSFFFVGGAFSQRSINCIKSCKSAYFLYTLGCSFWNSDGKTIYVLLIRNNEGYLGSWSIQRFSRDHSFSNNIRLPVSFIDVTELKNEADKRSAHNNRVRDQIHQRNCLLREQTIQDQRTGVKAMELEARNLRSYSIFFILYGIILFVVFIMSSIL